VECRVEPHEPGRADQTAEPDGTRELPAGATETQAHRENRWIRNRTSGGVGGWRPGHPGRALPDQGHPRVRRRREAHPPGSSGARDSHVGSSRAACLVSQSNAPCEEKAPGASRPPADQGHRLRLSTSVVRRSRVHAKVRWTMGDSPTANAGTSRQYPLTRSLKLGVGSTWPDPEMAAGRHMGREGCVVTLTENDGPEIAGRR
jgi:hypothetical protein